MSRSTEEELAFLESLVNDNASLVNCKRSDEISRASKRRAWENITEEFNSVPQFKMKTTGQLQKCWENLKSKRKMEQLHMKRVTASNGKNFESYSPRTVSPLQDQSSIVEAVDLQQEYYRELVIQTKQETELRRIEHNLRQKKLELEIQILKENSDLEQKRKIEKHDLEIKILQKTLEHG